MTMCIRCGNAPANDANGYCINCGWAVRAEIEDGFYALSKYLRSWAAFGEWEKNHDMEVDSLDRPI